MATALTRPLAGGDIRTIDWKSEFEGLDGISEKTMRDHWKLYEGYVNKWKEIEEKLKNVDLGSANQIYSEMRALKTDLSFAIGGVKNHQLYFSHMGGDGSAPGGWVAEQIDRQWGGFDGWKADMKATGLAGRGWAWLAFDWDTGQLFNYIGDTQNTYPIWNATPLVALDVYEHAYFADFGTDRATYIDTYFKNMDWSVVEQMVKAYHIDEPAA